MGIHGPFGRSRRAGSISKVGRLLVGNFHRLKGSALVFLQEVHEVMSFRQSYSLLVLEDLGGWLIRGKEIPIQRW